MTVVGGTNIQTVGSTGANTILTINSAAALPTASDGQSLIHNGNGYEGVASPTISFQITANGSSAYRLQVVALIQAQTILQSTFIVVLHIVLIIQLVVPTHLV